MNKTDSSGWRTTLLRRIAAIEGPPQARSRDVVTLGARGIDAMLGGGLARGRLHEVYAGEAGDASAAAGFAAMLARRIGGNVLWLRQAEADARSGALHPHGLTGIGLDPATLVLVVPPDPPALLTAAADVTRCPEVGVAVIELWREPRALDLTAGRRLALAAAASGVTALMLRIDADAAPGAAQTRWEVRAAASTPVDGAPGWPTLDVALVRQRGRPPGGRWIVEWDGIQGEFRACDDAGGAALSGAGLPDAADRPAARERQRA